MIKERRKPTNFADAVILAEIIYDFKGIFLIPSFRAFSINPGRLNCLSQLIYPTAPVLVLLIFTFRIAKIMTKASMYKHTVNILRKSTVIAAVCCLLCSAEVFSAPP